jgi:hypothetical protein
MDARQKVLERGAQSIDDRFLRRGRMTQQISSDEMVHDRIGVVYRDPSERVEVLGHPAVLGPR